MAIIQKLLNNFHFGNYSANLAKATVSLHNPKLLFGGIILVMVLLWGISLGRTRALVSLICIYIAFVFDNTFIYLKQVDNLINISPQLYITRVTIFILVYCIVFVILNRSILKPKLTISESSIVLVLLVSFLQLGLLTSIIANMLPSDVASFLPKYLTTYIATRTTLFYWTLAPLLSLLFMKNDRKRLLS